MYSFVMGKITVSKIKELRERKGMTQSDLAVAVGKTETTVRNWEHGRTGMDWIKAVVDLCNALECSPEELISDEDV
jgi:transcriptional regulator with XRE-family HTH domain